MEGVQMSHMNGGIGEQSYAHNSLLQKKILEMTESVKEEAVSKIYKWFPSNTSISIADLGCSSGPNTLFAIRQLVTTIYKLRRKLTNDESPVNIQILLNDLPGNDFNSIFTHFPSFKKQLKTEIGDGFGNFFIHGVPGSFYEELFQPHTLHFIHSSSSLHWLSQVPKWVGETNKTNICVSDERHVSVRMAYQQQFKTDFGEFLRLRSQELMNGGVLVFTLLCKSDDPFIKGSTYVYEVLGLLLHRMVHEGLIDEEKWDGFNMPLYTPTPTEITMEIGKESSFQMNCLEVSTIEWVGAANVVEGEIGGRAHAEAVMNCVRAVMEPMLVNHFGQGLMEEVFRRYCDSIGDIIANDEMPFFTNITVSLTKIK